MTKVRMPLTTREGKQGFECDCEKFHVIGWHESGEPMDVTCGVCGGKFELTKFIGPMVIRVKRGAYYPITHRLGKGK